ncbi:uncharacterized protein N0V89_006625 [Didymosphaeria variabile]|uniref:RING-type domain-containing protein n=1 Tax=Didymosphaeria variabile TaxID=1932322 RepID=A0A9W8XIJ9_9PLEO|nr:uncharacterized protein N0V89_006625 [Didymosphaeria variabile]KAJ4351286.1 hypothetical protein N0V89_006625 [Didymosphaeria variabile]
MPHPSMDATGYYQMDYVQHDIDRVRCFEMGAISFTIYARQEFLSNGLLDLRDERANACPEDGDNCPICIEPFDLATEAGLDNNVEVIAGCGHIFHFSCLWTWLNSPEAPIASCPMCRRELFPNPHYMGDWAEVPRVDVPWGHLIRISDNMAHTITALADVRAKLVHSDDVNARLAEAESLAAQLRPLFIRYEQIERQIGAVCDNDLDAWNELDLESDRIYDTLRHLMRRVDEIVAEIYASEIDAPDALPVPPAPVNAAVIARIDAALVRVPNMPENYEPTIEPEYYPLFHLNALREQRTSLGVRFMQLQQQAKELNDRGEPVPQELENEIDQAEETLREIRRQIDLIENYPYQMSEM